MMERQRWLVSAALASALLGACVSAATKESVRLYEQGNFRGAAGAADRGVAADRDDEGAWRMKLRAALALGDAKALADGYAAYGVARGGDDAELLAELAQATIAQGLTSPSVALRIGAIRAVEESELLDLADQVASRMEDRDDRVVATAAAAVLRGYADAVAALDEMLHSEDAEARRIAVDGLGRKVAKLAVADLSAAADDGDAGVRRTALTYLSALRDPALVPVFQRHVADADAAVRAAAVRGLAEISTKRAAVASAELAALVAPALADPAIGVRLAGVALAKALGDRAGLQGRMADPSATVAVAAALALDAGAAALAPLLDRGLAAAEWSERVAALNQVAVLGAAAAVAKARAALGDADVGVRLAAARALAHAGAKAEAIAAMTAVLDSKDATAERRLEAAVDLAQAADPRGPAALDQAVRGAATADERARAASAHRLARKVTPGLVAALADPSGPVRIEAASALAAMSKAGRD
jgi:HEAT repeat protein